MRIVVIVQHLAGAFEHEPNAGDFLLHQLGIDTVQRIGIPRARSGSGHVILDDEHPTRLERLENGLVEDFHIGLAEMALCKS